MSEAGRGKNAIFDQDSNPWTPWNPTKKINYQNRSQSPIKNQCLRRYGSNHEKTEKMLQKSSLLPLHQPEYIITMTIQNNQHNRAMYFASSMRNGRYFFQNQKLPISLNSLVKNYFFSQFRGLHNNQNHPIWQEQPHIQVVLQVSFDQCVIEYDEIGL